MSSPALVLGHRVDGQIAPPQILFQRHLGGGVKPEARVARRGLALGAGQRIFLVRARMQEDREIPPDRLKPRAQHLLRRRADHHPVAVLDRQAEQFVAHRAAHGVGFHVARTLSQRARTAWPHERPEPPVRPGKKPHPRKT